MRMRLPRSMGYKYLPTSHGDMLPTSRGATLPTCREVIKILIIKLPTSREAKHIITDVNLLICINECMMSLQ